MFPHYPFENSEERRELYCESLFKTMDLPKHTLQEAGHKWCGGPIVLAYSREFQQFVLICARCRCFFNLENLDEFGADSLPIKWCTKQES